MGPHGILAAHGTAVLLSVLFTVHAPWCAVAVLLGGAPAAVPLFPAGLLLQAACVAFALHHMRAPPTAAGALVAGRSMGIVLDGAHAFLAAVGSGAALLILRTGAGHTPTHASEAGLRAGWVALAALVAYHLGGRLALALAIVLAGALAHLARGLARTRADARTHVAE